VKAVAYLMLGSLFLILKVVNKRNATLGLNIFLLVLEVSVYASNSIDEVTWTFYALPLLLFL